MTILVVAIAPDNSIDTAHQRKLRKTGRWLINNRGEQEPLVEDTDYTVRVIVKRKGKKGAA